MPARVRPEGLFRPEDDFRPRVLFRSGALFRPRVLFRSEALFRPEDLFGRHQFRDPPREAADLADEGAVPQRPVDVVAPDL